MTTLTGSALIALAEGEGFLDADAAWAAAHVDEAWQTAHWGEDYEAAERQKRRFCGISKLLHAFSACVDFIPGKSKYFIPASSKKI